MHCNDKAKDLFDSGAKEPAVRALMEKCVGSCVDDHLNLLPSTTRRLKENLESIPQWAVSFNPPAVTNMTSDQSFTESSSFIMDSVITVLRLVRMSMVWALPASTACFCTDNKTITVKWNHLLVRVCNVNIHGWYSVRGTPTADPNYCAEKQNRLNLNVKYYHAIDQSGYECIHSPVICIRKVWGVYKKKLLPMFVPIFTRKEIDECDTWLAINLNVNIL